MRETISVCILTYNEEQNIERCLASVYDWVDEIIIIDGRSTDNTVKKARAFGDKVKVYSYDNPPNFLINKQRSIDKATKDWLLQLDADEVVSKQLKSETLAVLNLEPGTWNKNTVAYWIPRLTYFLGSPLRKGGQYPDYCLRFYRKGIAQLPLKTIHDQVKINLTKAKKSFDLKEANIDYLKGNLEHFSYPDFNVYLRKWIQYGDYEGNKLYKQNESISIGNFVKYFGWLPLAWFVKTYFRHKGFQDGLAGFVFSVFSALRYWLAYINLYEKHQSKQA